jgi:hypothetical protein
LMSGGKKRRSSSEPVTPHLFGPQGP